MDVALLSARLANEVRELHVRVHRRRLDARGATGLDAAEHPRHVAREHAHGGEPLFILLDLLGGGAVDVVTVP